MFENVYAIEIVLISWLPLHFQYLFHIMTCSMNDKFWRGPWGGPKHGNNWITCLATLSLKVSLVSFASLFSTGLMADQTGNYISSFKMTGGVLMLAFVIPFALIFINRRKSSSQSNSAGQEKFVTRKQQTLLLEQMWQSMTFLLAKNISYHYLRFKDFFLVSTLPTFFSLLTRVFRVTVTRLRSLFGSVYSNLMHAVRWRAYNLFSFEINIFENPIFVKKRW